MINYQSPTSLNIRRAARASASAVSPICRVCSTRRARSPPEKTANTTFNCPLDQSFFEFTGINHEQLLAELKRGKSDSEMLTWVNAHTTRALFEVVAWSQLRENFAPGDAGAHTWIAETIKALGPERDDIRTYFDLLDFEDYASFGGKA